MGTQPGFRPACLWGAWCTVQVGGYTGRRPCATPAGGRTPVLGSEPRPAVKVLTGKQRGLVGCRGCRGEAQGGRTAPSPPLGLHPVPQGPRVAALLVHRHHVHVAPTVVLDGAGVHGRLADAGRLQAKEKPWSALTTQGQKPQASHHLATRKRPAGPGGLWRPGVPPPSFIQK